MTHSLDDPSKPYIPGSLVLGDGPCRDTTKKYLQELFSDNLYDLNSYELESQFMIPGMMRRIKFESKPNKKGSRVTTITYKVFSNSEDRCVRNDVKSFTTTLWDLLYQVFDRQLHNQDFAFVSKGEFPSDQKNIVVQYVLPDRAGRAFISYHTKDLGYTYYVKLDIVEYHVDEDMQDLLLLFTMSKWLVIQAGKSAIPLAISADVDEQMTTNALVKEQMIACVNKCRQELMLARALACALAFVMGFHVRLGANSPIRLLGTDCAPLILGMFFGRD
jgi:hypothetical protein